MKDKELEKIWQSLDTRITTTNDRTKGHTIQIKQVEKKVKELEKRIEALENKNDGSLE